MAKTWKINIYYYCIITILFSKYCVSSDNNCYQRNQCLCEFSNQNILDISSIHGNFTRDNITYIFSGCKDNVNIHGCPPNSKFCKYDAASNSSISLGDDWSFVAFDGQTGAYNLSLSVNKSKVSTITLVCTNGYNNTVFTDVAGSNNSFYFFSPSACIVNHHITGGLSTGSVLIVLLFIGCVFYFVGGAIVLHCIRGARGKEMIPNIDFWQNLPSLVKDGLIFILNGCRPTAVATADSYDRI